MRQPYSALKLKNVEGRGDGTYNSKKVEKEHKEETKEYGEGSHRRVEDKEKEEGEAPFPFVTHGKQPFFHSVFSNVEVYINNQQVYNSNGN